MASKAVLRTSDDLLICDGCGTQFPDTKSSGKDSCKICDDPRQFIPLGGQSFSTLTEYRNKGHKNIWWQDEKDKRFWFFRSEPKLHISQRGILIQTDAGNILWDLITLLDQETVDKINELGGLKAIVISHPHYYSTWADWSKTFQCPVYTAAPDAEWLERTKAPGADLRLIKDINTPILEGSGATAVICGGHFPGSMVLHWGRNLFIADTIVTIPSSHNPVPGKPGVVSYSFFWSIANGIPLHADDVLQIWKRIKHLDWDATYGAFEGMNVKTVENEIRRGTGGVKGRLLETCKIYCKAIGYGDHAIMQEKLP